MEEISWDFWMNCPKLMQVATILPGDSSASREAVLLALFHNWWKNLDFFFFNTDDTISKFTCLESLWSWNNKVNLKMRLCSFIWVPECHGKDEKQFRRVHSQRHHQHNRYHLLIGSVAIMAGRVCLIPKKCGRFFFVSSSFRNSTTGPDAIA